MVTGSEGRPSPADEIDALKIEHCPALATLRLISGKWKTRILWVLRPGPMGFGEMRRRLGGASPKVLTEQLRQLEADGLIYRTVETEGEVRLSRYGYTPYGATLIPVLDAIGEWGLRHEGRADGED